MGKCFVSFFLLWFLHSGPVYAVTIVDVTETLTVIQIEYLSDCEWIEIVETQTTTTYRTTYNTTYQEPYSADPGFFAFVSPHAPLRVTYPGFHHPCFPDPEDKEAVIPDYCFAPPLTVNPINGSGYATGYFREWSDAQLSYSTNYINICGEDCGGDSGDGDTGGGTNGNGGGTGGGGSNGDASGGYTTVPEPRTLGLAVLGIGLVLVGRKMKKERE